MPLKLLKPSTTMTTAIDAKIGECELAKKEHRTACQNVQEAEARKAEKDTELVRLRKEAIAARESASGSDSLEQMDKWLKIAKECEDRIDTIQSYAGTINELVDRCRGIKTIKELDLREAQNSLYSEVFSHRRDEFLKALPSDFNQSLLALFAAWWRAGNHPRQEGQHWSTFIDAVFKGPTRDTLVDAHDRAPTLLGLPEGA